MIDSSMVTTNIELNGYKITKSLGVVRGIIVRSRSLFGNIAGGFQTLFGGRISIYQQLCVKTREEAFQHMVQHAEERGANAIINMRYDANKVIVATLLNTSQLFKRTFFATLCKLRQFRI